MPRIAQFLFIICIISVHIPLSAADEESVIITNRIALFNKGLPAEHPRLLIKKSELADFKIFLEKMKKEKDGAALLKRILLEPKNEALPGEPVPVPKGGKLNAEATKIWQDGYALANNTGNMALRFAFMYMTTGEEKYGRESARWLLHIASWDVNGGINIRNNDEAFIQSLRPMIFAYDWVYGALTPDERKTVEQAIKLRLDILWKDISRKFSLIKPTPPDNSLSHPMRFISTLGQGGLALYKESTGADRYLAWAYEYYNRQFPVWGGDDGGWAEGLEYWGTGSSQHLRFLEGMQILGFNDPLKRPFFKNNGYFGLYNMMPYPFTSFGDLTNITKPNPNRAMVIEKYAIMLKDPYLKEFAGVINNRYPDGFGYYEFNAIDTVFHKYRNSQVSFKKVSLADIPQSRKFSDVGWAVMHSALGDKDNDIMLGLKSSPYGSASHSFSDQNAFVINAFGEPLAISSGYREWYDSPHHVGWTRATISKNSILINGKGQPIKDANASGKISRFYSGKNYSLATGDASAAWREQAVWSYRHVLFVNRRYFIILDETEARSPSSWQWLLHAREKMEIDERQMSVTSIKGNAGLFCEILYPAADSLTVSQTDRYAVEIDKAYRAKMPNEWHATVGTKQKSQRGEFVSFLYPYKKGETVPSAQMMKVEGGSYAVVQERDSQDHILFGGERMSVSGDGGRLKGFAASVNRTNGSLQKFFVCETTEIVQGDFNISSDKPVTLEGDIDAKGMNFRMDAHQDMVLRIKMPFNPGPVNGVTRTNINYDAKFGTMTLKVPAKTVTFTVLRK
jgi:hypothetical protein